MSLINQMLRDLDARRAPAADRPVLPDAVHAAQRDARGPWPALAGVALVLVAAGGGAWYWMSAKGQAPVPAVAVVPQPAVAPPVAAQAVQPAMPATAPGVAAPGTAGAPASAPQPAAVPPAPQPAVAAPVAVPKPKPALPALADIGAPLPQAAKPFAPAPRPKPESPPPAAPRAKPAPAAAAEGSIEKRPHGALANEAAENEYHKAVAALRRGANTEAFGALQAALRFDAAHVSARQALLSLLVRQQRLGEALALAEEGLAIDPAQAGWAMAVARLQLEGGKLAEAVETIVRHARYAEQNADYQAFHAVLLQKQKRFAEAVERYRAALALRPSESRWWYGLGLTFEADQKGQEARGAFLRAKEAGNLPPELASGVERHLR